MRYQDSLGALGIGIEQGTLTDMGNIPLQREFSL